MCAAVAQLVERVLGKDEVMGSSPISSFVRKNLVYVIPADKAKGNWLFYKLDKKQI